MTKHIAFLACNLFSIAVFTQPITKVVDDLKASKKMEADTSKKRDWKSGGNITINLNQQNSSFWVGATEQYAMAVGAAADLYSNYAKDRKQWDNTLRMNYGMQRNSSTGRRKNSDFIDLYSKFGISINPKKTLAASILFNGRSQFTDGLDYSDPTRTRRTSGFFAPATLLLSPGLDWKPVKDFSLFLSPLTTRWVIVSNGPFSYSYPNGVRPNGSVETPLALLYGVNPARRVNTQMGAFLSTNYAKDIFKNVAYSSRLDLYSNYLDQPQNIDVFWTNSLIFKVNKWLVLNYQWNVAYDDEVVPAGRKGPRTQFLGTFGIGVSSKF
ncbi:MAG: DUF3078 domain-containing protein [Bacteroidetes bacterium]|nr:MAG: DUF3078 domain-containing protein [Bacteroidota bacterium]